MKRNIKAILFDWDGVLIDSMTEIGHTVVEVCRAYGINITLDYYHENFSQPWWKFYEKLGINLSQENERQKLYDLFHVIHEKKYFKYTLFDEVKLVLNNIFAKNIQMGIVSSGPLEKIKPFLDSSRLNDYFDEVNLIGSAENKVKSIVDFCQRNNFNYNEVVMVGDLPSDIIDAKDAGVCSVGVARTKKAEELLSKVSPDYILNNLNSIFEVL